MANADITRKEEHGGLSVARAEFASSLARRLDVIQSALAALEQQPLSAPRRDNLLRRLHALGASAKVLGFAAAAESLSHAERQLRTGLPETLSDDLIVVRNLIAGLPVFVLRGTYSMLPTPATVPPGASASPSPVAQGPWCVLVCGGIVIADTLRSVGTASSGFELIHTQDTTKLRELCAMYGPDVVVLDGALPRLEDELRTLKDAPETTGLQLVVAQAAIDAAPALQRAGAHNVLTSGVSPVGLWRAVNRTRPEEYDLPPAGEPFGDIVLRDLCERISREIRRGLLEASDAEAQSTLISLGEGTEVRAAIWAAVTRIRDIVAVQSEGRVQFGPGPDGSIVLAPGAGLRGHTIADSASIDLAGRRIVVADDDPAVLWFVGGTLRAAGAEVREVQDGRRALNLVYQWWPELVVSDVLMPGLDGFALCREIKRDVVLRDVPVILLSWKEDLLFRLRELGADADGYLRKEASASALVDRVRELLWPRISLERRLSGGQEVRGRLDGITPRTLIDAACRLNGNLTIALRDASAHYDVRVRDRSMRAITRRRVNGVDERGQSALAKLLGVSAGRFSVVEDDQPAEDDFSESSLDEVLRAPILRARAAQRVLSGSALGMVEQVTLDPEAFVDELSMLPLSLRPLVDELLRGTPPRQLLASGAASPRGLELLLTDAARRGAVRGITGPGGEDLLTREILALSAPNSEHPSAEAVAVAPASLFTFQLSPSPVPVAPTLINVAAVGPSPTTTPTPAGDQPDAFDWTAEASWEVDNSPESEAPVRVDRSSPFSRPRFSAEWGSEKRTAPGVGTEGATVKLNETPELSEVVAAAISLDTEPGPPEITRLPDIAAPVEDEAIFPLLQSGAPAHRLQRNTPQSEIVSVVDVLPTKPTDTLSSELAPRLEIGEIVAPEPQLANPDHLPAVATSSRDAVTDAPPISAILQPSPAVGPLIHILDDNSDVADSAAGELKAVTSDDQSAPDRVRQETPKAAGPRGNNWVVPVSLLLTAGLLSFVLALPIVKRFKSSPAGDSLSSANSAKSGDIPGLGSGNGTASLDTLPASAPREPDPAAIETASALIDPKNGESPAGLVVPPDKGLVLVKTGRVHSIFVDDEFMGRGPERTVTLSPGQHKIRTSLNGEEHTETVDIVAGRVIQLSLEQAGK